MNILKEIHRSAYRIGLTEAYEKYIIYTGFGLEHPVLLQSENLSLSINGNILESPYHSGDNVAPTEEILLDRAFFYDELVVQQLFHFHPVYGIPTITLSFTSLNPNPIKDIAFEWTPHLPTNSSYAILTNEDDFWAQRLESGILNIVNIPRPFIFDDTSPSFINSLIVFKPEAPCQQDKSIKPSVLGDPSYHVKIPLLLENVRVSLPFRCLRSLRDCTGNTGITFLIHQEDWLGAVGCLSAPTRLQEERLSIMDNLVSLYSPIIFYSMDNLADITSLVAKSANRIADTQLLLVPPEGTDDHMCQAACDSIKEEVGLNMVFLKRRSHQVCAQIWMTVAELIGIDTVTPRPAQLLVTSVSKSPIVITAALTPGLCLGDAANLEFLPQVVSQCNPCSVVLDIRERWKAVWLELRLRARGYTGEVVHIKKCEKLTNRSVCFESPEQRAATRTAANLFVSLFLTNDDSSLKRLWKYIQHNAARNYGINNAFSQLYDSEIRDVIDTNLLFLVAKACPELIYSHPLYVWAGPSSCVVSSWYYDRWQDAIVAAAYARGKGAPYLCLERDEELSSYREAINKIEAEANKDSNENENLEAEYDALTSLGTLGFKGEEVLRAVKLGRKVLTLFPAKPEVPWELMSWETFADKRVWLAERCVLGRIVGITAADTASIAAAIIQDSHRAPESGGAVLFAVDQEVDCILGNDINRTVQDWLRRGFIVDTLLKRDRNHYLRERFGQYDNFRFQDYCTPEKLSTLLKKQSYALHIVAGHGGVAADGGASIRLDNTSVVGYDCPNLRGYPIVIWNSCSGGVSTSSKDDSASNTGLSVSFLTKGASHFIAPLYSVRGTEASMITTGVGNLCLVVSPARALRMVKRQLLKRYAKAKERVLGGMWYVVYGDPSVSRFYILDGIAEVEDICDSIPRRVPRILHDPGREYVSDESDINRALEERETLRVFKDACVGELAVAQRWCDISLDTIERLKGQSQAGMRSVLDEYKKGVLEQQRAAIRMKHQLTSVYKGLSPP